MKSGALRRCICGFIAFLMFAAASPAVPAVAAEAVTLRASQYSIKLPNATVYFTVQDENGNLIDDLKAGQLTATMGSQAIPVKELKPFSAVGEGVGYLFLVDVSKSIRPTAFASMKDALKTWVASMGEKDRAAIVTFGTDVRILQDFTADRNLVDNRITELAVTDEYTQLHKGIVQALDLGRRTDEALPTRRAIVVLSDGEDDYRGGMTRQEVLERLRLDRVPIYAVGYLQEPQTAEKERNLKSLGEFARISGGEYYEAGEKPLNVIYQDVQKRIGEVWQGTLDISEKADGNIYRLQLSLNRNGRTLTDGMLLRTVKLVKPEIPQEPDWKTRLSKIPLWAIALTIGCLLLIVAAVIAFRRKRRAKISIPDSDMPGGLTNGDSVDIPPTIGGMGFGGFDETSQVQGPAYGMGSNAGVANTVDKGIAIRLTPMGNGAKERAIETSIAGKTGIGRSRDSNELAFPNDPEISGRHCELFLDDGVMLRDLGSKNGTFVNGARIGVRHKLRSGDIILIGRTELRFMIV